MMRAPKRAAAARGHGSETDEAASDGVKDAPSTGGGKVSEEERRQRAKEAQLRFREKRKKQEAALVLEIARVQNELKALRITADRQRRRGEELRTQRVAAIAALDDIRAELQQARDAAAATSSPPPAPPVPPPPTAPPYSFPFWDVHAGSHGRSAPADAHQSCSSSDDACGARTPGRSRGRPAADAPAPPQRCSIFNYGPERRHEVRWTAAMLEPGPGGSLLAPTVAFRRRHAALLNCDEAEVSWRYICERYPVVGELAPVATHLPTPESMHVIILLWLLDVVEAHCLLSVLKSLERAAAALPVPNAFAFDAVNWAAVDGAGAPFQLADGRRLEGSVAWDDDCDASRAIFASLVAAQRARPPSDVSYGVSAEAARLTALVRSSLAQAMARHVPRMQPAEAARVCRSLRAALQPAPPAGGGGGGGDVPASALTMLLVAACEVLQDAEVYVRRHPMAPQLPSTPDGVQRAIDTTLHMMRTADADFAQTLNFMYIDNPRATHTMRQGVTFMRVGLANFELMNSEAYASFDLTRRQKQALAASYALHQSVARQLEATLAECARELTTLPSSVDVAHPPDDDGAAAPPGGEAGTWPCAAADTCRERADHAPSPFCQWARDPFGQLAAETEGGAVPPPPAPPPPRAAYPLTHLLGASAEATDRAGRVLTHLKNAVRRMNELYLSARDAVNRVLDERQRAVFRTATLPMMADRGRLGQLATADLRCDRIFGRSDPGEAAPRRPEAVRFADDGATARHHARSAQSAPLRAPKAEFG